MRSVQIVLLFFLTLLLLLLLFFGGKLLIAASHITRLRIVAIDPHLQQYGYIQADLKVE